MEYQSEEAFRHAFPDLPWLTATSSAYEERREIFSLSNQAIPRAILCPRNGQEVSAIVRFVVTCGVPFTVRSGGHNLQGSSIATDAICIDLRDIDFVDVSPDGNTAKVGGGIIFGKLTQALSEKGLATPFGSVPSVGYVGWASLGGYGALTAERGLGVDQILEAEVVNAKGEIVHAGTEMLTGIRGAGGNFGVIVSVRIKVYPLKTLLAGIIILDSSTQGIAQTFKDFMIKYQAMQTSAQVPPALQIQPLVFNLPQLGRALMLTYMWSSADLEEGRRHLENILKLGPVIMNTVSEMTAPEWMKQLSASVSRNVWGASQGVSFSTLSPKVLSIIGQALEVMPSDSATGLSLHMLSAQSPSVTNESLADSSCFSPEARQGHFMLELLGMTSDPSNLEESQRWMTTLHNALRDTGEAMKGTYVSLIRPGDLSLDDIYGEKWEVVKSLKKKFDPDKIFKTAVPDVPV